METRDLQYFEVIAELGHMGRAAKKVFRTQPALTQSVRRLEQELGTELFERVGRNIRLTPMGEKLLEKARLLRRTREEATQELTEYARGHRGHVRLGCSPTMAAYLVPRLTVEMLREAPEMTMDLSIGTSDLQLQKLKNGEIDLLLTPLAYLGENVESIPVVEDAMVVLASAEHPLFARNHTIHDLAEYRWLLLKEAQYSRQWLSDALARHGCPPPMVQMEADIVLYLKELVRRTRLLCFLSNTNIQPGDVLREVDVPELVFRRQFKIAFRAGSYLPPIAARMVAILRAMAGERGGSGVQDS